MDFNAAKILLYFVKKAQAVCIDFRPNRTI